MPKVLMAVATGRQPACAAFYECFWSTELPPGSQRWRVTSAHISRNMNVIMNKAVDEGFDYLFYVDDDLTFPLDVVMRMLDHDVDRVTPLVCHRCPPFYPFLLESCDDNGKFTPMTLPTHETGLIKVPYGICGAPGLIATSILKKLDRPYFPDNQQVGDYNIQGDVGFTMRLHELGVESYCDLDIAFRHHGNYSVALEPHPDTGEWKARLDIIRDS